jgi:hypothetical protein
MKKKEQVPTPTPKSRRALFQGGENDMNITIPTTASSNSINPIHIQFGTFFVELKRDNENNMVSVVPCSIKIKGRNFIKIVIGHIMSKPRTASLQGGEDDELMSSQIISASN